MAPRTASSRDVHRPRRGVPLHRPRRARVRRSTGTSSGTRPTTATGPALKNQAAAYPGRGANLRRLDHVNYLTADVPATAAFLRDTLGARCTEQIVKDDGSPQAIWYSLGNKSYDLVYTEDWTGSRGRLHHLAFATDTREEILRAADVCLDAGVHIETGPHKHAIQQTFFLYVWEPGGNRDRDLQRRRAADPRPRLEDDQLDPRGTRQGPGVGPEDHRHVPHPRHAGRATMDNRFAAPGARRGRRSRSPATWSPPGPTYAGSTRWSTHRPVWSRRRDDADAVRDADLVLSVNSAHDALPALENSLPRAAPRGDLGGPQHRRARGQGRPGRAARRPGRRRWSTSR